MKKYVVRDATTDEYLSGVCLGHEKRFEATTWNLYPERAIQFEDPQEAATTIQFISDVIDWERALNLEVGEVSV